VVAGRELASVEVVLAPDIGQFARLHTSKAGHIVFGLTWKQRRVFTVEQPCSRAASR
jgi:hypothetical protein